jgi:hypothetical protein
MEHYRGAAKENGITEDEIGTAQAIVMAVAAGRINAQFEDVRRKGKTSSPAPDGSCAC